MSEYHQRKYRTASIALLLLIISCSLIVGCVSLPPQGHGTPAPSMTATPAAAGTGLANGTLQVHFLDVGQGDSILVKYGNKSMLVDGGPIDAGQTVGSYLKGQGIGTIDVLVSTHPHADHIGGLLTVLRDFPVKVVYDSGIPHTTQTYEEYLTLIDRKNIRYIVPERGNTIDLGPGVTVQVLSPPPGGIEGGDLNENSIVLKITQGSVGFLLASDAGFKAEDAMLASGHDLKSQALKVGHHGSKYSSSRAFLKAVDPGYSVIEVGADNPYGHPAPATLARLDEIGSKVYRTDRDGNIVMVSDGKGIIVSPQRTAPA
ncbi:MAG: ComEC/Rec2 family competence protein [Methanocella sp.]